MQAWFVTEDEMEMLKRVQAFLYGNNALSPGFLDLKRDNANLLNLAITSIEHNELPAGE